MKLRTNKPTPKPGKLADNSAYSLFLKISHSQVGLVLLRWFSLSQSLSGQNSGWNGAGEELVISLGQCTVTLAIRWSFSEWSWLLLCIISPSSPPSLIPLNTVSKRHFFLYIIFSLGTEVIGLLLPGAFVHKVPLSSLRGFQASGNSWGRFLAGCPWMSQNLGNYRWGGVLPRACLRDLTAQKSKAGSSDVSPREELNLAKAD